MIAYKQEAYALERAVGCLLVIM